MHICKNKIKEFAFEDHDKEACSLLGLFSTSSSSL